MCYRVRIWSWKITFQTYTSPTCFSPPLEIIIKQHFRKNMVPDFGWNCKKRHFFHFFCPGAKLSGAKLSWCQIVLVPNCPGAKLSTFIILVPNCPLLLSWCQIVPFIILVPNCPVPNCPTIILNPQIANLLTVSTTFRQRSAKRGCQTRRGSPMPFSLPWSNLS